MYERLLNILNHVGSPRVLLVGDFMLDRYLYGNMERISPEAPVPVLNVTSREERPGGAGSVATDLAMLGARVWCVGAAGDDANAQRLRNQLSALEGVDVGGLLSVRGRPTTCKERVIGLAQHRHQQQLMRLDEENAGPIPPAAQNTLIETIEKLIPQCDVVCIEDYNKGVLSGGFSEIVIEQARRADKKVIVDPASIGDYSRYRGSWMIKPNRRELGLATGTDVNGQESWRWAAQTIAAQHDIDHVVVTLDKQGAYLYTRRTGTGELIPTRPRNVYDVTGAGDMVLAMLGLLIGSEYKQAEQPTLQDVVCLANIAGGLEVERFGSVGVTRHEILAELAQQRRFQSGKVRTADELAQELDWHRQRKLKIVFTNGCFDILHPGHIQLLSFAKSQGDILVVGLNSDDSVRGLKGPTRPILKQQHRAELLSALEAVDYIVIFDTPDPLWLIQKITPDVLVKGSDWQGAVVGQDWVQEHGGTVALMPLQPGHSTTNIIAEVLERNSRRPGEGGE
jgi:D-beta-D-heptose 7-phosphate kinase / D-beta-D-heptose 1-phosphate adenosyltransferase